MRLLSIMLISGLAIAKVQVWQSNEVPVWFVESHAQPMLDIAIVFDAGSIRETKLQGLSTLTNKLFFSGCADKSETEIATAFERYGSEYSANPGYDGVTVNVRMLTDTDYLWPTVRLFGDCLRLPKFDAVKRTKRQMVFDWRDEQNKPYKLALTSIKQQYYGQHAYGHTVTGIPHDIEQVSLKDLQQFYRKHYNNKTAHVILVGDLSTAQAKQVSAYLTKIIPTGKALPRLKKINHKLAQSRVLKLPNQAQVTTVIAYPSVDASATDLLNLELANYPLGFASGRLHKRLRTEKAYVYGVSSMPVVRKLSGEFYVLFQSRPKVANDALKQALATIKTYVRDGPTADELVRAKASYSNRLYLTRSSNSGLLRELVSLVVTGRGLTDYYQTKQKILAVDLASVQSVLKKIFVEPTTAKVINAS